MKKTNTKLLGMFVVGGLALFVGGLLIFGGGQFFREKFHNVIYFHESLAGLAVGAAVTSQGVRIGSVTRIVVEYDVRDLSIATPVFIEIDPSRLTTVGGDAGENEMPDLIKKGMRAQLGLESLVTGQKVINLVIQPDTKVVLVNSKEYDVNEIPSIPSATYELKAGLDNVVKQLAEADIAQIGAKLREMLSAASKLLENPEIPDIIHNANLAVPEVRSLVRNLDADVDPVALSVRRAADQATTTLETAQGTLEQADGAVEAARQAFEGAQGTLGRIDRVADSANSLIKPGSQTHFELVAMMREITAAARSVRSLANTLERDPESVLFGKTRSGR